MSEKKQLELPYELFTGNIASRTIVEQQFKPHRITAFKIPFNKIEIWDGHNARTIFDAEEIRALADDIFEHGQETPFQLLVTKDGRYLLKRGERRYRAYQLLIKEGKLKDDVLVPFSPVTTTETDEDMVLDLYRSNNFQEKLLPIDQAEVARRLKYCCGEEKTNKYVADKMKLSRQTVDNLITISQQSDDIKNEIRQGRMTVKSALEFVSRQKKDKKEADKKEEESHITSAAAPTLPEDPLKKDLQELKELDEQANEMSEENQIAENEAAQKNRERIEQQRLKEVAVEVYVSDVELVKHIGKRLAAPAKAIYFEDFVDEGTGETVPVECATVVLEKDAVIDENNIKLLIEKGVKSCFINKEITVAASVITEPIAEPEKLKYDKDRPEIAQIQNIISLADRISVRAEKLDISEGDKKDLMDWCKWIQNDALPLRDWIHTNKKQNKIR